MIDLKLKYACKLDNSLWFHVGKSDHPRSFSKTLSSITHPVSQYTTNRRKNHNTIIRITHCRTTKAKAPCPHFWQHMLGCFVPEVVRVLKDAGPRNPAATGARGTKKAEDPLTRHVSTTAIATIICLTAIISLVLVNTLDDNLAGTPCTHAYDIKIRSSPIDWR